MKKTATITINDKVITVNELTMKQILGLKENHSGDIMQTVQTLLPMITDATADFLMELTPSELMELYEKVKEVNSTFFTLVPLDKILVGYHETIISTIQMNLAKLSVALPQPATV